MRTLEQILMCIVLPWWPGRRARRPSVPRRGGLLLALPMLAIGCGGSGAATPPPMQMGPIELKNPSLRVVDTDTYNLTFVLDNHAQGTNSVVRADLVQLDWGGQLISANADCASEPFAWSQELSSVITVAVRIVDGMATATVPCGGGSREVPLQGTPAAAPHSGSNVVVAVDGILSDAAPFTASASAPVL
jgi:hypothetical protein